MAIANEYAVVAKNIFLRTWLRTDKPISRCFRARTLCLADAGILMAAYKRVFRSMNVAKQVPFFLRPDTTVSSSRCPNVFLPYNPLGLL